MAEFKYQKYIVEGYSLGSARPPTGRSLDWRKTIVNLNDNRVKGACFSSFVWYLNTDDPPGPNSNSSHTHDFDEILGFAGSDWEKPDDLCAEVEFWMDNEKYILNKSCMVFVPKGLKHCPLKILKCDRPIFHFGIVSEPGVTNLTRNEIA
jgi:hypothetical protein